MTKVRELRHIEGAVCTHFSSSTHSCAASRTNSKKKSTSQPTLHFGDVCDLDVAKALHTVRNAGEPDSLPPLRRPTPTLQRSSRTLVINVQVLDFPSGAGSSIAPVKQIFAIRRESRKFTVIVRYLGRFASYCLF